MKQILILISSLLLFSCSKATHTGTTPIPPSSTTSVIDLSPTLESRILGGTQHYAVYLPPSYTKEPQRRYPVLLPTTWYVSKLQKLVQRWRTTSHS